MKSLKSRLWRQDAPGPTSPTSPTAVTSSVSSSCGGDLGDPLLSLAPLIADQNFSEKSCVPFSLWPLRCTLFPPLSSGRPPSLSSRGAIPLFACPVALGARDTGPGGSRLPPGAARAACADSGPTILRGFQECQSWERRCVSSAETVTGEVWFLARLGKNRDLSNTDKAPLVFDPGVGEVGKVIVLLAE